MVSPQTAAICLLGSALGARMGRRQKFLRALGRVFLPALLILAECAQANADEPLTTPKALDPASSQRSQPDNGSPGLAVIGDTAHPDTQNKALRAAPSESGASDRGDGFRLGDTYLGLQTEKSVQVIDRLRQSDCIDDEDCADYTGLPRSAPGKRSSLKTLRKPFLGLSIKAPLQW
jgi:hypothetical protein